TTAPTIWRACSRNFATLSAVIELCSHTCPLTVRRRFHESLCHDHRRGVWSARCGAHLACHRGRSRPGEEPLVHCHHPCRSGSLFLGLARTQTHPALLTLLRQRAAIRKAIIMSDVNVPYLSFDRDALSRVARAGVLTGVIDGLFSSVLSVAFYN